MKKDLSIFLVVLYFLVFYSTNLIAQNKETYLQKDMSAYTDYVISMTNPDHYSDEDYLQWHKYLNAPHPSVSKLNEIFESAANEFGVPVELLKAIGQVENNWVQIGPSIDRAWGIMHLTDNEYSSHLNLASNLINCDPVLLT